MSKVVLVKRVGYAKRGIFSVYMIIDECLYKPLCEDLPRKEVIEILERELKMDQSDCVSCLNLSHKVGSVVRGVKKTKAYQAHFLKVWNKLP